MLGEVKLEQHFTGERHPAQENDPAVQGKVSTGVKGRVGGQQATRLLCFPPKCFCVPKKDSELQVYKHTLSFSTLWHITTKNFNAFHWDECVIPTQTRQNLGKKKVEKTPSSIFVNKNLKSVVCTDSSSS